ncbi:TPA: hypothetical protein DCZ46_02870 [Candidatus Campbellbacteria bacterium]|nr:MAG: protein of unknown function with transmembrane region [Candidatus Campbellbacteria bacterium GW2011_OD1_34_28]KKP74931.1 MAG: hypothetical protein UR74_C0002G0197 [Candidatus Campbellbacteria bacterium GW2011_GWD2_35_24]KKP75817.1 MAG: hypothetical protein UR75_C0002G0198 [Candidatus Campbellbacteria bacterium GW2011_GWC2_35_28]KKP76935.1 MAG: hypothetical protein UR76_C0002G0136 [Candidatus Campbellbacteria bacterium GW2011_GWC1_35_31]KKP78861.1 MAG: hypothetical protein UR79_C0002G013
MKRISWGWPTTLVVIAVIVILTASLPMPSCTKKVKVGDSPSVTSGSEIEWPRAYKETVNPDREEFVYPGKDMWLEEPVYVSGLHWAWFDFVDKNISDDRMYVRCANVPENLDNAKVRMINANSNQDPFPGITGCRYFDMKLPPDTRVGNPVVSFRISKM